jgi:hypothetical protein
MTRHTRVILTTETVSRPISGFGGESTVHYHVETEFENHG